MPKKTKHGEFNTTEEIVLPSTKETLAKGEQNYILQEDSKVEEPLNEKQD